MINVVTVHWQTPKWIEVQLSYLERNLAGEFRVFAALNGISDLELRDRFHYAVDLEGTHEEKLNALAKVVIEQSDPTDILMFVDGDAFPVQSLDAWMHESLRSYPLAAVRRDENVGDRQPHPCFCVTTVGFWREIDGDWCRGGTWINAVGKEVTDPGGNLLHQLQELDQDWLPLVRTNTNNPHPLWFAIYGHLVYHHGAGFRAMLSRTDFTLQPKFKNAYVSMKKGPTLGGLRLAVQADPSRLAHLRPHHLLVFTRAVQKTILERRRHWYMRQQSQYVERTEAQAEEIFARLQVDPDFYLQLDGRAAEASSDPTLH
jgi:hypothetical protein